MGWTDDIGKIAAITVGCVVAVSASIAGDTSQDLKTGFLLGATPSKQQIGQLIGVLTSAAFVCMAVLLLDKSYGFGTTELPAPQATLMKLVIEGVLQSSLPWGLVGIGVLITVVVELLKIPSLPFAVGVYLPVTTMVPVFLGGVLRKYLEKGARSPAEADERREQGVLFGSGLVGGEGLMGVGIAAAAFIQGGARDRNRPRMGRCCSALCGPGCIHSSGHCISSKAVSAQRNRNESRAMSTRAMRIMKNTGTDLMTHDSLAHDFFFKEQSFPVQ